MKSTLQARKIYLYIVIILITQSLTLSHNLSAQSVSKVDLRTINVDDMSDEQVLSFIQKAEARGLGEAEAEELARQSGMPESQILKLKTRIRDLKLRNAAGIQTSIQNTVDPISQSTIVQGAPFGTTVNVTLPELNAEEKRIFGIDLFRRGNVSFIPGINLPTPIGYELGPGDEIIVDLWGDTQQSLRFSVSREGTIKPDKLGPIYVNGLTIENAEKKIIDRLSQIYSGLKGKSDNRTIFHQVSLGNIRTINVEIIGAVEQPGVYSLPSLASLYYALHASGGPSRLGSFRDIRLIRNGKLLASADVYTFLTTGIKSGDLRLKNGDVIIIPPYQTRVTLEGEVKIPAIFELKADESLGQLLEYASGFTDLAFRSVVGVKRNGEKERELLDVSIEDYDNFQLRNGDLIEVGRILNRFSNRVVVEGAVFRAGEYQLAENMTVKTLINKAEGLRGDAFLERATIYRSDVDFSQSILAIDIKGIMEGTTPDLELQNEDLLIINSIYDLREESFVQISGEVLEQGVYPFFEQMTVQDLVILAGGFKESAFRTQIEISRRNNTNDLGVASEIISIPLGDDLTLGVEGSNTLVYPFDQVFIRKLPGYGRQESVTIEGEVVAPGTYAIGKKEERISDVINRAKGLTPYAFAKGAILVRQTEFSTQLNSELIDQNSLKSLREKILLNQSGLKNSSRSDLLSRIAKLKSTSEIETGSDVQGSSLKKAIIQQSDSLGANINISGREPVALNLDEIIKLPGSKYDLIIQPGDVISIPVRLQTVRVAGEVTSPLSFRYDEGFDFKDYINRSGGFLQSAKKSSSYVQYANGERRGVRRFLFFKSYPKVEPGSTIIVSKKPTRGAFNFQAIIATVGSVATLALVLDRLAN